MMRVESGGTPEPEEAAAIVAALEALFGHGVEPGAPAPAASGWRLAARALDDGYDAERALRRAKRSAS
jgi:hypothetical protein